MVKDLIRLSKIEDNKGNYERADEINRLIKIAFVNGQSPATISYVSSALAQMDAKYQTIINNLQKQLESMNPVNNPAPKIQNEIQETNNVPTVTPSAVPTPQVEADSAEIHL